MGVAFSVRAVHQHLARLKDAGLVDSAAGLWFRTDKDLDLVALEFGTYLVGEAQRERHERQRLAHHGERIQ